MDELGLEIGPAAFLILSAPYPGCQLPAGLEGFLDRMIHRTDRAWGRLQDLGRCVHLSGGDGAAAIASSGGGRGLGACVEVAVACVSGAGAIGPGLGDLPLPRGARRRSEEEVDRGASADE
jgi:hypothetical protein